ncbi:MAG TPA: DUF2703 domain-containing protein [Clostridiales bacterium]|nr:DUF2703 domain-containing protein [Clostridiales bacterium]
MAKTWYPVIDYQQCIECGTCIKKCIHGVYDKAKAPTPVVVSPGSCIDYCHGCGNICPQGAITYAGDDTGWTPPKGKGMTVQLPERCCRSDIADATVATTAAAADKQLTIDFLYLDLNTCQRCIATASILDEAVKEMEGVLHTLGYKIIVNKINIVSRQMAEKYRFVSSPTIRINGRDICTEVKENACGDCGDLCGSDVDCRVFVYEGREYEQPPKAMIIDGILKAIYSPQSLSEMPTAQAQGLPKNLETFFEGRQGNCCEDMCSCSLTQHMDGSSKR